MKHIRHPRAVLLTVVACVAAAAALIYVFEVQNTLMDMMLSDHPMM